MAAPLKHFIDGLGARMGQRHAGRQAGGGVHLHRDAARRPGVDAAVDAGAAAAPRLRDRRHSLHRARAQHARAAAARPTAPATWPAATTTRSPATRKPNWRVRWAAAWRRSRCGWHERPRREAYRGARLTLVAALLALVGAVPRVAPAARRASPPCWSFIAVPPAAAGGGRGLARLRTAAFWAGVLALVLVLPRRDGGLDAAPASACWRCSKSCWPW